MENYLFKYKYQATGFWFHFIGIISHSGAQQSCKNQVMGIQSKSDVKTFIFSPLFLFTCSIGNTMLKPLSRDTPKIKLLFNEEHRYQITRGTTTLLKKTSNGGTDSGNCVHFSPPFIISYIKDNCVSYINFSMFLSC